MEKKYIKPAIVVEKVVLLTNIQENSGVVSAKSGNLINQMTKSRDSFDENEKDTNYGEIQSTIW